MSGVNLEIFKTEIPDAMYYFVSAVAFDIYDAQHWSDDYFPTERFLLEDYFFFTEEYIKRINEGYGVPVCEASGREVQRLYECPVSMRHKTHEWCDAANFTTIIYDGDLTPFIPPLMDDGWFNAPLVNATLAEQLETQNFGGMTIRRAMMDYMNTGRYEGMDCIYDQAYLLAGPHPLPKVPRKLRPGVQNQCPFCSHGPLYCEACGHYESYTQ